MGQASEHIDIYGGPAEKLQEVRESLEQRWGYEPSNHDVISLLLERWIETGGFDDPE